MTTSANGRLSTATRGTPRSGCNYRYIVREQKCIEPLWESKSDYEIFALVSEKMGLRDEFTDGGKTELDWVKGFFDVSDLPKVISVGGVRQEGLPHHQHHRRLQAHSLSALVLRRPRRATRPTWATRSASPRRRAELGTFSGKIEFESVSLKQYFPDDEERPVVPRYIPSFEGHHTTELFEKYPLALHVAAPAHVVPLPLRQAHRLAQRHRRAPHQEGRACLVAGPPQPGGRRGTRGINNNDIVRLYNDRGSVLCIAVITDRVRPGVIHSYASAAHYDPLQPGRSHVDRPAAAA